LKVLKKFQISGSSAVNLTLMNLIKSFVGDKFSTDNNIMLDELDNFFLPHHHQTKATKAKTSFHEDFAISDTVDI
jgi:hypothetical protein